MPQGKNSEDQSFVAQSNSMQFLFVHRASINPGEGIWDSRAPAAHFPAPSLVKGTFS